MDKNTIGSNDMDITTKTYIVKIKKFIPKIDDWYGAIPISKEIKPGLFVHKYNNKSNVKIFKNCFTVIIADENTKQVNIKVYLNGSFQITGCRTFEICEYCILRVLDTYPDRAMLAENMEINIRQVMVNIRFATGIPIDIDKTNRFFQLESTNNTFFSYRSNPALNIKSVIEKHHYKLIPVHVIIIAKTAPNIPPSMRPRTHTIDTLDEYIRKETPDAPISGISSSYNKLISKKYTTILIFRSGSCIFSSIHENTIKLIFDDFMKYIKQANSRS